MVGGVAAVVVGELCDRARMALIENDEVLREVRDELEAVRYERDVLEASARELERRLAYGPGDVASFVHAARKMERADLQGLFAVALDLVVEHVADAASIFEVDADGRLVLSAVRGTVAHGTPGAERDSALVALSPLVARALQCGESASAFDLGDDELPPGPRMVAPLFDHTRAVRALLLVDDIAPTRLGPGTFRTFEGLAEWTSSSLSRLAVGAAPLHARDAVVRPESALVLHHRLGSPEALVRRVEREYARCERHALNVALVGVQFALEGERAETLGERLDAAVVELLARGLRASDGLHGFGFPGCYVFVLAGTDLRGAAALRARLDAGALAVERRLGVVGRTVVVGPEQGDVSARLALEALAARFRAGTRRPLGVVDRSPLDPSRVGGVQELVERIACEASLRARFGLPFQLLEITLRGEPGASTSGRMPFELSRAVQRSLRGSAEAFEVGFGRYQLLIPGLAARIAGSVQERLAAALVGAGVDADVRRVFDSEGGVDVALLVRTLRGGLAA